jgi:phenylacetate-CoA ligase
MIFQALRGLKHVEDAYVEVRSSYDLSDEIRVVAGTDASDIDADMVAEFLQARLRVRPDVIVRPRQEVLSTMEKAGGRKLKRFFDLRDNNKP